MYRISSVLVLETPCTYTLDKNYNDKVAGASQRTVSEFDTRASELQSTKQPKHSHDAARSNFFVCGKLADVAALVAASQM